VEQIDRLASPEQGRGDYCWSGPTEDQWLSLQGLSSNGSSFAYNLSTENWAM